MYFDNCYVYCCGILVGASRFPFYGSILYLNKNTALEYKNVKMNYYTSKSVVASYGSVYYHYSGCFHTKLFPKQIFPNMQSAWLSRF